MLWLLLLVLSIVLYVVFCSGKIWFGTREGIRNAKFTDWLMCLLASLIIVALIKALIGKVLSAVAMAVVWLIKIVLIIVLLLIMAAAVYYGVMFVKEIINRRKNPGLNVASGHRDENRNYVCANCGCVFPGGNFCPKCGTKVDTASSDEGDADTEVDSNDSSKLNKTYSNLTQSQNKLLTTK